MSSDIRRLGAGAAQFGQSDLPQRPISVELAGAMRQQGSLGARDTDSFPQKFVQLVGYRHSDSRPFSWIKPRPAPVATPMAISSDDIQPPLG